MMSPTRTAIKSSSGAYILVAGLSLIGILLVLGVRENSIKDIEEKEGRIVTTGNLDTEVVSNEDLKKEFLKAAKNQQIDAFLKKHDCSATKEDIVRFAKDKQEGALIIQC